MIQLIKFFFFSYHGKIDKYFYINSYIIFAIIIIIIIVIIIAIIITYFPFEE